MVADINIGRIFNLIAEPGGIAIHPPVVGIKTVIDRFDSLVQVEAVVKITPAIIDGIAAQITGVDMVGFGPVSCVQIGVIVTSETKETQVIGVIVKDIVAFGQRTFITTQGGGVVAKETVTACLAGIKAVNAVAVVVKGAVVYPAQIGTGTGGIDTIVICRKQTILKNPLTDVRTGVDAESIQEKVVVPDYPVILVKMQGNSQTDKAGKLDIVLAVSLAFDKGLGIAVRDADSPVVTGPAIFHPADQSFAIGVTDTMKVAIIFDDQFSGTGGTVGPLGNHGTGQYR